MECIFGKNYYILHEFALKNKKKVKLWAILYVLVTCILGKDDYIMHEFALKIKIKSEVGNYIWLKHE